MEELKQELITECKRQEENCLYTSASLFVWLRWVSWVRKMSNILLMTCSVGAATFAVLELQGVFWWPEVLGLLGTVFSVLTSGISLREIARAAVEFKNLENEFRQAANIASLKEFKYFCDYAETLFKRVEEARRRNIIVHPKLCYLIARRNIKKGYNAFDVDSDKNRPK